MSHPNEQPIHKAIETRGRGNDRCDHDEEAGVSAASAYPKHDVSNATFWKMPPKSGCARESRAR